MTSSTSEFEVFDPQTTPDDGFVPINTFMNRLQSERLPEEPPIALERTIRELRTTIPFVDITMWGKWSADRSTVIAAAYVAVLRLEDNKHVAEADISVLPEYRRRGIASRMLPLIADVAQREERRLLVGSTYKRVPSGEAFTSRLGGTAGQENHVNQLKTADVDRELLRAWKSRASERASGLELGFWDGPYPEEDLDAAVEMFESVNLIPRDDLDMEDFHFTAEHLRAMEDVYRQRGEERWTMYVRDPQNGKIAGFTEVMWNPAKPDLLSQYGTVVVKEYQNRGLGRWLKAEMLEKVLRDLPQVTRIQTGNADSNAPMLSINRDLGFKPYSAQTLCQVETERVLDYLRDRPEARPETVQTGIR